MTAALGVEPPTPSVHSRGSAEAGDETRLWNWADPRVTPGDPGPGAFLGNSEGCVRSVGPGPVCLSLNLGLCLHLKRARGLQPREGEREGERGGKRGRERERAICVFINVLVSCIIYSFISIFISVNFHILATRFFISS